jgi:hypothetical protein
MSAPPRIALVTSNFNYGRTLAATIDSVLNQSYPNLDYLVLDDGSTDDSVTVLERYAGRDFRWVRDRSGSQYRTLNRGFAETTGEIMGWINSDDILLPWTLRTVGEIFTAFPDVEWIMGAPAVIQRGAVQEVSPTRPFAREALELGLYCGGNWGIVQQESCFWRRRLWDRAGPLRTDLGFAADFELWMRFARHAELHTCAALIGGFTLHSGNRSRVNASRYREDIERAIQTLTPAQRHRRAQLQRWHDRYLRHRWLPGLKGAIRRIGGLVALDGPVIRRDLVAERFVDQRERVCP